MSIGVNRQFYFVHLLLSQKQERLIRLEEPLRPTLISPLQLLNRFKLEWNSLQTLVKYGMVMVPMSIRISSFVLIIKKPINLSMHSWTLWNSTGMK